MVAKSLHRSVDLVNSVEKSLANKQLIKGCLSMETAEGKQSVHASTQPSRKKPERQTTKDKILLSISGGQDSICLLVILNQLCAQMEFKLGLVWCHHLWQTDSFSLMRQITKISYLFQLNSCFAVTPKPIPSELLARNWRHDCSARICLFYNYYKMSLAHSGSDKTETILLNLMRGTGVAGLSPLSWEKKSDVLPCSFDEKCLMMLRAPKVQKRCYTKKCNKYKATQNIKKREHVSQLLNFKVFLFIWSPFFLSQKKDKKTYYLIVPSFSRLLIPLHLQSIQKQYVNPTGQNKKGCQLLPVDPPDASSQLFCGGESMHQEAVSQDKVQCLFDFNRKAVSQDNKSTQNKNAIRKFSYSCDNSQSELITPPSRVPHSGYLISPSRQKIEKANVTSVLNRIRKLNAIREYKRQTCTYNISSVHVARRQKASVPSSPTRAIDSKSSFVLHCVTSDLRRNQRRCIMEDIACTEGAKKMDLKCSWKLEKVKLRRKKVDLTRFMYLGSSLHFYSTTLHLFTISPTSFTRSRVYSVNTRGWQGQTTDANVSLHRRCKIKSDLDMVKQVGERETTDNTCGISTIDFRLPPVKCTTLVNVKRLNNFLLVHRMWSIRDSTSQGNAPYVSLDSMHEVQRLPKAKRSEFFGVTPFAKQVLLHQQQQGVKKGYRSHKKKLGSESNWSMEDAHQLMQRKMSKPNTLLGLNSKKWFYSVSHTFLKTCSISFEQIRKNSQNLGASTLSCETAKLFHKTMETHLLCTENTEGDFVEKNCQLLPVDPPDASLGIEELQSMHQETVSQDKVQCLFDFIHETVSQDNKSTQNKNAIRKFSCSCDNSQSELITPGASSQPPNVTHQKTDVTSVPVTSVLNRIRKLNAIREYKRQTTMHQKRRCYIKYPFTDFANGFLLNFLEANLCSELRELFKCSRFFASVCYTCNIKDVTCECTCCFWLVNIEDVVSITPHQRCTCTYGATKEGASTRISQPWVLHPRCTVNTCLKSMSSKRSFAHYFLMCTEVQRLPIASLVHQIAKRSPWWIRKLPCSTGSDSQTPSIPRQKTDVTSVLNYDAQRFVYDYIFNVDSKKVDNQIEKARIPLAFSIWLCTFNAKSKMYNRVSNYELIRDTYFRFTDRLTPIPQMQLATFCIHGLHSIAQQELECSEICELHLEKCPSTIRPLLALNRFDISKLCIYWELPVYPDQSNQKMSFLRNRVRKQLLPTIKLFFNSRIENVLLQLAEIFSDEDHYMNQITNKLFYKLGADSTFAHSPFFAYYYDARVDDGTDAYLPCTCYIEDVTSAKATWTDAFCLRATWTDVAEGKQVHNDPPAAHLPVRSCGAESMHQEAVSQDKVQYLFDFIRETVSQDNKSTQNKNAIRKLPCSCDNSQSELITPPSVPRQKTDVTSVLNDDVQRFVSTESVKKVHNQIHFTGGRVRSEKKVGDHTQCTKCKGVSSGPFGVLHSMHKVQRLPKAKMHEVQRSEFFGVTPFAKQVLLHQQQGKHEVNCFEATLQQANAIFECEVFAVSLRFFRFSPFSIKKRKYIVVPKVYKLCRLLFESTCFRFTDRLTPIPQMQLGVTSLMFQGNALSHSMHEVQRLPKAKMHEVQRSEFFGVTPFAKQVLLHQQQGVTNTCSRSICLPSVTTNRCITHNAPTVHQRCNIINTCKIKDASGVVKKVGDIQKQFLVPLVHQIAKRSPVAFSVFLRDTEKMFQVHLIDQGKSCLLYPLLCTEVHGNSWQTTQKQITFNYLISYLYSKGVADRLMINIVDHDQLTFNLLWTEIKLNGHYLTPSSTPSGLLLFKRRYKNLNILYPIKTIPRFSVPMGATFWVWNRKFYKAKKQSKISKKSLIKSNSLFSFYQRCLTENFAEQQCTHIRGAESMHQEVNCLAHMKDASDKPLVYILNVYTKQKNVLLSTLSKPFNCRTQVTHRYTEGVQKRKIIIISLVEMPQVLHVKGCPSIKWTPLHFFALRASHHRFSHFSVHASTQPPRKKPEKQIHFTCYIFDGVHLRCYNYSPIALRTSPPKCKDQVNGPKVVVTSKMYSASCSIKDAIREKDALELNKKSTFISYCAPRCNDRVNGFTSLALAPKVHVHVERLGNAPYVSLDSMHEVQRREFFGLCNISSVHAAKLQTSSTQQGVTNSALIDCRLPRSIEIAEATQSDKATIRFALPSKLELSARIAIGRFFAPSVMDQRWKGCLSSTAYASLPLVLDPRIALKTKQKKKYTNKLVWFFHKFDKLEIEKKELYWPVIISFLPKAIQRRFVKLFLVNQNLKQVRYSQIEHFLSIIKKF